MPFSSSWHRVKSVAHIQPVSCMWCSLLNETKPLRKNPSGNATKPIDSCRTGYFALTFLPQLEIALIQSSCSLSAFCEFIRRSPWKSFLEVMRDSQSLAESRFDFQCSQCEPVEFRFRNSLFVLSCQ